MAHPTATPTEKQTARLARRMYLPRVVGLGLGGVLVGVTLGAEPRSLWIWVLLAANSLLWPHLAYRLARRSPRSSRAERLNLVLDSAFGGFWVVLMGGNVLPSVLLVSMLAMNCLAVGGIRLLRLGLGAQMLVAAAGWMLYRPEPVFMPTPATLLACLPFVVIYPLVIGAISYRLAVLLSEKRAALAESEKLFRDTFEAMEAGVVLFDAQDRMLLCNDDFRRLYPSVGHRFKKGQTFRDMLELAISAGEVPGAVGNAQEWINERMRQHASPGESLVRLMSDGRWRRLVEQRLPSGGVLAFSIDVSELMLSKKALGEANAELERIAQTDALTGLANRRLFDRRLEEECSRAARYSLPLALVLIDVDYFKRVNDACGHTAGDECLKRIAVVLSSCSLRGSDVVARFGGEEFAVLLPHTAREEAVEVAMRYVRAIDLASIPHPDSPIGPNVTISVGVASLEVGVDAMTSSRLIRDADEALYRAKAQGRHRVQASWGGNAVMPLGGARRDNVEGELIPPAPHVL